MTRRLPAPPPRWFLAGLALLSLLAAVVVARISGPDGPWLWNLDMPKIDYPLASFFHDALVEGRLPLWNDQLGLGFPLYAEGQIGAFYPPNWLLFQFPPLVALDLSRVLHLTVGGVGAGVLVLRLAGTRRGACVAALGAVLGGAIATKLEWHNLVSAYAFMPWVLVPLVRRPHPTRRGLVAAGILFGIQALAGHPNTWLLTGLAAAILLLATLPRPGTVARVAAFGLIGGTVGAVQLVPTVLLTTLSVRSRALSANDVFASAATPFDILGFGFQNAFVRVPGDAWDPVTTWYPDGVFALFEASAYVGLPILALAAVAVRVHRVRPLLAVIAVCLAIPIVAAFEPEPWLHVPILNGLRSPVRAYVVVALLLAVLAGVGVGRLGRAPGGLRRAVVAVGVLVGAYGLTTWLAAAQPGAMERLILDASTFLAEGDAANRRELALAALTQPWPLVLELVAAALVLGAIGLAGRRPELRTAVGAAALAVAALPLFVLGPLPNPTRAVDSFSFAGSEFVRTVAASEPRRVLTLGPPGWYAGIPDQLAAGGVTDLRQFTSLDLLAGDELVRRVSDADPDGLVRRAVGVDTVVTFEAPCPGREIARVEAERATICRDDAARRPPYWLPGDAVAVSSDANGSPIRPRDAELDVARVATAGIDLPSDRRDEGELTAVLGGTAAGWVWIDRSWWPGWSTTVDGASVETLRALGGQLVAVPDGARELRQSFLPWDALIGLAAGLVALVAAGLWVVRDPRLLSPWARRRP